MTGRGAVLFGAPWAWFDSKVLGGKVADVVTPADSVSSSSPRSQTICLTLIPSPWDTKIPGFCFHLVALGRLPEGDGGLHPGACTAGA